MGSFKVSRITTTRGPHYDADATMAVPDPEPY